MFAVRKQLADLAGEWGTVQLFSSTNRIGLEEAGEIIGGWILKAQADLPKPEGALSEDDAQSAATDAFHKSQPLE